MILWVILISMLPKQSIASTVDADNSSTYETTSFRIKVNFLENKLTVALQDLNDFVVYSKVFGDNDQNKQINKRVTLQDIFYSLTEATNGKVKTDEDPNIYQFGSVIQKDGVPYYKVQSGGKITVYVSMFDRRKKQQINLGSLLKLQKVREMNQLQIVKQKSLIQKKKLLAQISTLKRQCAQKTQELSMMQDRQKRIQDSMKQYIFQKISGDGYSQSIFNKMIPFNKVYTFKVGIVRARYGHVGIGVVDYEKHKTVRSYYDSDIVVAYYWHDYQGRKYPSGVVEGAGYREGEIVQVTVNLANRSIYWSVDGQIRASYTHRMLGDESKIFMPFVQVHYSNTQIQWLG